MKFDVSAIKSGSFMYSCTNRSSQKKAIINIFKGNNLCRRKVVKYVYGQIKYRFISDTK